MIDVIRAIAELVRAVAWPIVATIAMFLFRPQLASLLTRLRRGAGAEFDPLPQEKGSTKDIFPTTTATNQPTLPRTPATIGWEETIRQYPPLSTTTDPAAREQLLVTLSARAVLISIFEQVEGSIWASQVGLLNYLNLNPQGVTVDDLQKPFYEPASQRHPQLFSNYPFDRYLNFLASYSLLVLRDGRAHITDQGREYLAWRIDARKWPKTHG